MLEPAEYIDVAIKHISGNWPDGMHSLHMHTHVAPWLHSVCVGTASISKVQYWVLPLGLQQQRGAIHQGQWFGRGSPCLLACCSGRYSIHFDIHALMFASCELLLSRLSKCLESYRAVRNPKLKPGHALNARAVHAMCTAFNA